MYGVITWQLYNSGTDKKLVILGKTPFSDIFSFFCDFCDGQYSKDLRYPKKWLIDDLFVVDEYEESWRPQVR